ncbi:MAG TPA: hypothetical protein VN698_13085 [Bacteroidia bacterium]|nr:hypothetical protein [Bacteroidia bacterium]
MEIEINLTQLEKHFEKNGYPVNIALNTSLPNEPTIVLIKGKLEQNGSRREYIDTQDFEDILFKNNILGDNGLLKMELTAYKSDLKSGLGNRNNREEKMDSLVYDTLVKYFIQMLDAAIGKVLFPEIKYLEKHKDFFIF